MRTPALVIAGELDRLIAPPLTRRIAALIPDADYAEIPGGGHICSVDSAAAFNPLLLRFLARDRRRDGARLPLLPTSWRFSRIRLAIAGADADHDAQGPHGRPPVLTLHRGGTHASAIELPWR
ncbi:MAG: hypothetical protein WDN49_19675 [Acetobacteraceae bacterium]